jgi:hypothetical protein
MQRGQGGRIYMPLLLLLIGWHEISISKTGFESISFFPRSFITGEKPYLTRCWQQLKVKLIGRGPVRSFT